MFKHQIKNKINQNLIIYFLCIKYIIYNTKVVFNLNINLTFKNFKARNEVRDSFIGFNQCCSRLLSIGNYHFVTRLYL